LPVYLGFPEKINSSQVGEVNLIKSFLLIPDYTLPLLIVAWSLIHEIYFYLAYFVKIKLNLKLSVFLIIMLLIHLISNIQGIAFNSPLINLVKSPLNLEFLLGLIIGQKIISSETQIKKIELITILSLSLTIVIICLISAYFTNDLTGYTRFLLYGVPASCIVISLLILEIHFNFKFRGIFSLIGDSSYSLYLNHILSLNVLFLILSSIFPDPTLFGQLSLIILIFIITILIGKISYDLIEKKILKLL